MAKSNRFYLACLREVTGTNLGFHGKTGGYPSDVSQAREYTLDEAQRAWNGARSIDLPVCADRVDAETVLHVDCQLIPYETTVEPGCTRYVAFQKCRWDGNDVYWVTEDGLPTTDFTQAAIFEAPGDDERLAYLPFEMADSVKRPTFDVSKLDRRRMIQAAGLITPEHIKKARRRSSGKIRWNCPGCGRLHWQHNPHDFNGCNNTDCDEWSLYAA